MRTAKLSCGRTVRLLFQPPMAAPPWPKLERAKRCRISKLSPQADRRGSGDQWREDLRSKVLGGAKAALLLRRGGGGSGPSGIGEWGPPAAPPHQTQGGFPPGVIAS